MKLSCLVALCLCILAAQCTANHLSYHDYSSGGSKINAYGMYFPPSMFAPDPRPEYVSSPCETLTLWNEIGQWPSGSMSSVVGTQNTISWGCVCDAPGQTCNKHCDMIQTGATWRYNNDDPGYWPDSGMYYVRWLMRSGSHSFRYSASTPAVTNQFLSNNLQYRSVWNSAIDGHPMDGVSNCLRGCNTRGICVPGNRWGGVDPVLACDSSPCLNSGVCSGDPTYTCDCTGTGYEGTECQTEIDECDSGPCLNGGSCTDLMQDYTCACATGYTGDNCETDIDECASSPCDQSIAPSTCSDPMIGNFSCSCSAGVTGDICQTNIDDCASSPCLHGGLCTDEVNGYSCDCSLTTGSPSQNCSLTGCSSNPCPYYQVCSPRPAMSYQCSADDCSSSPCASDELCIALTGGGYTCQPNGCYSAPCQWTQVCLPQPVSPFYHCSNDGCDSSPCAADEICEADGDGGYLCHPNGCYTSPCPWHTLACLPFPFGVFVCDYGDCSSSPCLDGEFCVADQDLGYYCKPNPCDSSPCDAAEECFTVFTDLLTYECIPPPEPPCHSVTNPCLNGGTCDDDIGICSCVEWNGGEMCELDCTIPLACGPTLDIEVELPADIDSTSDPDVIDLVDTIIPTILAGVFGGDNMLFVCGVTDIPSITVMFPNPGGVDETNIVSLLEPVLTEIDTTLTTTTVSTGVVVTLEVLTCTFEASDIVTGGLFCVSSPCQNGATCDEANDACLCLPWTDGSMCELDCRLPGACGPQISITCVLPAITSTVSTDNLDVLTTTTVLETCVGIFGGDTTHFTCTYTDDTISIEFPNPGTTGGTTMVIDETSIVNAITPAIVDIDTTCGTTLTNTAVIPADDVVTCHFVDDCELDSSCDAPPACDSSPCQNNGICTNADGLDGAGYFVYYYGFVFSGESRVYSEWVSSASSGFDADIEADYLINRPEFSCDCTDTGFTGDTCNTEVQPPVIVICTGFDLPLPETPPYLQCNDTGYESFVEGYLLYLVEADATATNVLPNQISDLQVSCEETLNVTFTYDPPVDTDPDVFINVINDEVPDVQVRTDVVTQVVVPDQEDDNTSNNGDGTGVLIGSFSGVIVLIIMAIFVWYTYTKKREKKTYVLTT